MNEQRCFRCGAHVATARETRSVLLCDRCNHDIGERPVHIGKLVEILLDGYKLNGDAPRE